MSHASMLKARRQHQKTKKRLAVTAKQAKRLAKQALAGPAAKKEKVKKEKVNPPKGQADQGGAWRARREEEQCGCREKRRVLAFLDPEVGRLNCVESRRPCLPKAADNALPRMRIT